jgi:hypothetical protein
MKKLFTTIVLFLLFFISAMNLQAQDYPKLSIGVSAMAEYRFKIDRADNFNVGRYAFGSTIGAQIKIDLTKRIALLTGLYNGDYGYKTEPDDSTINGPHYGNSFKIYTKYHYFNLNIPVMVKYKIISRPRFFWDIGSGISVNCFYLDKNFHYVESRPTSIANYSPSKIRTLNLYSKFSSSLNYKIKYMTLGFDLGYYLAILDDNFHNYYYGIGAGLSVMFDIDKKKK